MSDRAKELLAFLKKFRAEKGYCPTNAEIAKHFRVSAVSIFNWMRELERAGSIRVFARKSFQLDAEVPYNQRQREIVEALRKHSSLNLSEVAGKLKIAPPSLWEHLQNLANIGAILLADGKATIIDKEIIAA